MSSKMRVAVIGGGISGLAAACVLAKAGVDVVLYEKEDYLGGRAKTIAVDGVELDLGFMVLNRVTYPDMMEFFETLGVDMEESDMSFSVSLDNGQGCEWGTRNGLSSLFAHKSNFVNPYFWQMLRQVNKFKDDVVKYLEKLEDNPDINRNETLGHFVESQGYSELFRNAYIVPICASICHCPAEEVTSFSAFSILSYCRNHLLLPLFGHQQWPTVRWRLNHYVHKVREELESRGCQIRTGCRVHSVITTDESCTVLCEDGTQEMYKCCMMAVRAPDAVKILGSQATFDEIRILGAFQYVYGDIFLHQDKKLMPQNPAVWSALNFLQTTDNKVCLTYWLNVIQNISGMSKPFLVTLNPPHTPEHTLLKWSAGHPVPSVAASKASFELDHIQGKRGIWFCSAYESYGFHVDGLKTGMVAAHSMLGNSSAGLNYSKHIVPSVIESGARLLVTRFLGHYISAGCLILLEEGGTIFIFEGNRKKKVLRTALRIHNPEFYCKVAAHGDLGFADAYIDGDFSFVDKDEGLLNLIMIFIANGYWSTSFVSKFDKKRDWWTSLLCKAGIPSAKYFFQHVSRRNTHTHARKSISRDYHMRPELYSLFLDETLTFSSAIFKMEEEDLKIAQLRKISLLIEKAKIEKHHEVLDIGCGWGSLAFEVVKRTGCKYTGLSLLEGPLKFAEMKVKEAGLQDHIKFHCCDYRQFPTGYKYDRIIVCEMIEGVGHEYMADFFGFCESILAEDGLLVLQFGVLPDAQYDEHRKSPDFIKEYIYAGVCFHSFSSIISAMAATSRLSIEHLENFGMHYYQTQRCWRKNFLQNRRSKKIGTWFSTSLTIILFKEFSTPTMMPWLFVVICKSNIGRLMVDVGSSVNVIFKNLWDKLQIGDHRLSPCRFSVHAFNELRAFPKGSIILKVKVGPIVTHQEFVVMN